jgi:hypothetical protein
LRASMATPTTRSVARRISSVPSFASRSSRDARGHRIHRRCVAECYRGRPADRAWRF